MYDAALLIERLKDILHALERIPDRFEGINAASDFLAGREGADRLDAIRMVLIAAGEAIKQIDRKTEGRLFARYP